MVSVAAGTFKTAIDIANAACQHMGCARIVTFADDSVQADEIGFRYDKLRQAELRRNVWRFSIRTALLRPVSTTSALFTPQAWDATKTYVKGSVASYNGIVYQARMAIAVNMEPDQNPALWDQYYGSPMATLWVAGGEATGPQPWATGTTYAANTNVVGSDNNEYMSLSNGNVGNNPVTDGGVHWQFLGIAPMGQGYSAGELVYTQSGSSTPQVFVSVANANDDIPGVVPDFVSTQTYDKGETVTYSAVVYQSTQDFNVGNTPTGTGPWVTVPTTQNDQYTGQNWVLLGTATLAAVDILYPLGVGPTEQSETLNIFMLPFGYMREAPQVPKSGSTGFLGAPSNDSYRDWTYGDTYFVSRDVQPQRFRFAADVADVGRMDPMFCEMLGARAGMECNERVTQSSEKLQAMEQIYKKFGDEARAVNGIETGSTEPALDDFIAVRR